ncbi:MAG: hypothetical protein M3O36_18175 [Myxococcota bacterium]|nr:hypothetical protein [Myxococcota bacterium]
MRRKPPEWWMRIGFGMLSWAAAAVLAEVRLGSEIDGKVRRLEDRIEMQLRGSSPPPAPPSPSERSHEESIEPWELVSV